ncbi:VP1 [Gokushovirus WZ-2015a]|nr:VP1 [Gokushovirus WZ-2015a]
MQHLFSQVPKTQIPRSKFNRSHGLKTTFDAGYLVPIYVDEVLPGDTFVMRPSLFARMATLISPIMDNLYMDTFFFFVPERLVYDKFQRMCGEQENPDDSTDFVFPTLTLSTGATVGSLFDYMGLPTGVNNLTFRVEPFRAYNLIWNEWFRDENLQDSVTVNKGETGDTAEQYTLLRRGKRHDYFTSALPWPQKGPGVELPFGGNANVVSDGAMLFTSPNYKPSVFDGVTPFSTLGLYGSGYGHSDQDSYWTPDSAGLRNMDKDGNIKYSSNSDTSSGYWSGPLFYSSGLKADLTSATSVTINQFREAFQIQKWYERAARGGTRYTEILRSFFGVISPDARLQRPEYLGGGSQPISLNIVANTSATNDVSPQANLAAFGVGSSSKGGFTKSFVEHGWIIGLVNVRADLTYQQGINRMWSRSTKFDMYWPPFAHLGEQAVLNKEIYAQGTDVDSQAFGYQERYAEYRYYPSQITGKFRSTYAQSLDNWHLAQKFENLPTLSSQFIQDNPPIGRVIAVPSEPQFLLDAWFDLKCVRPMPVYSVPGLVDHF